jgi:hypothetical protein
VGVAGVQHGDQVTGHHEHHDLAPDHHFTAAGATCEYGHKMESSRSCNSTCSNPNPWTDHANPVGAAERQLLPDFDAHHAQLCGRHAEHYDHQLVLQHIWVQPTNHYEALD